MAKSTGGNAIASSIMTNITPSSRNTLHLSPDEHQIVQIVLPLLLEADADRLALWSYAPALGQVVEAIMLAEPGSYIYEGRALLQPWATTYSSVWRASASGVSPIRGRRPTCRWLPVATAAARADRPAGPTRCWCKLNDRQMRGWGTTRRAIGGTTAIMSDKAKVEVGVQVVQHWILAGLRHQQFFWPS